MAETERAIDLLKKMVIEQKKFALPEDTLGDSEIESALMRLKDHDRLVTTKVIQVLQGNPVDFYPNLSDPDLESTLSHLYDIKPDQEKRLIEQYIRYKVRLDEMLKLAIAVSDEIEAK